MTATTCLHTPCFHQYTTIAYHIAAHALLKPFMITAVNENVFITYPHSSSVSHDVSSTATATEVGEPT